MAEETIEKLSLSQAATLLLNECRMVLPGIQTLFGFQLVAVFNDRFARLPAADQQMHLWATALVVTAIAMVMTPAAYHRQAGARHVTLTFVRVCTWLLVASMAPLAVAITLEFYIVCDVLWKDAPAAALSLGMLAVFAGLWWLLPRVLLARGRAARARFDADAGPRPPA